MAFIIIKLMVNGSLCFLNHLRVDINDHLEENRLRALMYLLLAMHSFQLIFLRKFYGEDGKVNTRHWWVWTLQLAVYSYVVWKYNVEMSDPTSHKLSSRQVWIPLDIMLTVFVSIYYLAHLYIQTNEVSEEDDYLEVKLS